MPRIRSLKPEFWGDEKLAPLDAVTRLTFLGLVSLADDAGRLIDNVKTLDGQIFPETSDSCREALDTLARLSRVHRYTAASGQRLIQIVNWSKHQKVDKPSQHVLPAPSSEDLASLEDTNPRDTLARLSRESRAPILDLGSGILDQGAGKEDVPAAPDADASFFVGGESPDPIPLYPDAEIGTRSRTSDTLPDFALVGSPGDRVSGGEILAAWIVCQPSKPSKEERGKQGAEAGRIAKEHSRGECAAAWVGMGLLFPHAPPKREPWDLFDLRKKFPKAVAMAANHPALRSARGEAEFDLLILEATGA